MFYPRCHSKIEVFLEEQSRRSAVSVEAEVPARGATTAAPPEQLHSQTSHILKGLDSTYPTPAVLLKAILTQHAK